MEADQPAGGGGGGSFHQHHFAFNEDDEDCFLNHYNIPMSPEHNDKEVVELGSSSGSPRPMDGSRSAFTPFRGISDDPLHEQPENDLAIEEFNQGPFQINQSQPNGENSASSLSNAPIVPMPLIAFDHVLGAPSQPQPPQMGDLNQEISTQNFLPGALAAFQSYQFSNPPLVYAQNERETPTYISMPMHNEVSVRDTTIVPLNPQNNTAIQPCPPMEQLPMFLTSGQSENGTNAMMAGPGAVNGMLSLTNQQQATLHPQQSNAPSRFWPPSRPVHIQVIPANVVFDTYRNWTSYRPYGDVQIRPLGPQPLLNQPQQVNQMHQSNAFTSQGHHLIQLAGPSTPLGYQEVGELMMMQSPWILESSLIGRHQEVGGQQQHQLPEHVPTIPNVVVHSQRSSPVPIRPRPSVPSHIAGPQHHSSGLANSPVPFRFPPAQLHEMLNQQSDGSSQRSGQFQNSPHEQGNAKRRRKCREVGESSAAAAKRSKRSSAASSHTEVNRNMLETQEEQLSNDSVPSEPREINCLYDLGYETLGQPIDPHLRLFQRQLNQIRKSTNA